MEGWDDLAAFEAAEHAILVTDEDGILRVCNRLAADLLCCDPRPALGRPCWTSIRLLSPDGSALCGPDCIIRGRAREARSPWCQTTLASVPTTPSLPVELVSFPLPPSPGSRSPIMHFLTPLAVTPEAAEPRGDPRRVGNVPSGLAQLSRRETEVLRLLAFGLSTPDIATMLFISPVTVRNHVENILRKLGVHSRLDAVLTWLGSRTRPRESAMRPSRPRERVLQDG